MPVAQVLRSELLLPLLRDPEVLPRLAPYLVRICTTPLFVWALLVVVHLWRGVRRLSARCSEHAGITTQYPFAVSGNVKAKGAMCGKTTRVAWPRASRFAAQRVLLSHLHLLYLTSRVDKRTLFCAHCTVLLSQLF